MFDIWRVKEELNNRVPASLHFTSHRTCIHPSIHSSIPSIWQQRLSSTNNSHKFYIFIILNKPLHGPIELRGKKKLFEFSVKSKNKYMNTINNNKKEKKNRNLPICPLDAVATHRGTSHPSIHPSIRRQVANRPFCCQSYTFHHTFSWCNMLTEVHLRPPGT